MELFSSTLFLLGSWG